YLEGRMRMRRWVGLTIACAGTFIIVAGLAALIFPPVVDQPQALVSGLPQTLTNVQNVMADWAQRYPFLRRTELADPQSGLVAKLINDATGYLSSSLVPYLRAGGKLFIEGVSVLVMALYLARAPALYRDGVVSLVAPRRRAVAVGVLDDAGATLRAWLTGQILAMFVLGSLTALGLLVLGVPYWLAFGAFTGLVAVVPFFGTIVSTLLPALFVVGTGDWVKVVAVISLGVLVHVAEANLVAPLIMERKVSLPPVLTIASVLVMGTLLGVIGLIVAVLDRREAGKTVEAVLGVGGNIPVVGDFAEGLALGATAVLIGIAPAGGQLPPEWRGWLKTAIEQRLEIWSGLHTFIGDDP